MYSFQVEWKPDKILFALPLVTQFWVDKIEFTFLTLSWWCVSKWIYLRNLFMSQVNWNVAWNYCWKISISRKFHFFYNRNGRHTFTLLIERWKTEERTKFNECMHINIHRLNSSCSFLYANRTSDRKCKILQDYLLDCIRMPVLYS